MFRQLLVVLGVLVLLVVLEDLVCLVFLAIQKDHLLLAYLLLPLYPFLPLILEFLECLVAPPVLEFLGVQACLLLPILLLLPFLPLALVNLVALVFLVLLIFQVDLGALVAQPLQVLL